MPKEIKEKVSQFTNSFINKYKGGNPMIQGKFGFMAKRELEEMFEEVYKLGGNNINN